MVEESIEFILGYTVIQSNTSYKKKKKRLNFSFNNFCSSDAQRRLSYQKSYIQAWGSKVWTFEDSPAKVHNKLIIFGDTKEYIT